MGKLVKFCLVQVGLYAMNLPEVKSDFKGSAILASQSQVKDSLQASGFNFLTLKTNTNVW